MKLFGRWLFNGLAVLSLLLCLATAGLWVRSYWRRDMVSTWRSWSYATHDADSRRGWYSPLFLGNVHGVMLLQWIVPFPAYKSIDSTQLPFDWENDNGTTKVDLGNSFLNRLGFEFDHSDGFGFGDDHVQTAFQHRLHFAAYIIDVPHWFIFAVTAILPAIWLMATIKRRRLKRWILENRCAKCSYDLRATPDRCPECGTVPPKKEIISN